MGTITAFLSKWAFAIVLCIVAVTLLFAVGCCVYTAITNPFVGIVGMCVDCARVCSRFALLRD